MHRRNLLRRHLNPTVKKLGLPATVDFRSFRTMHSSLMSSVSVRPEVTRDKLGSSQTGQCKPFCVNPYDPAISQVLEKKWSGREDFEPPTPWSRSSSGCLTF